MIKPYNLEDEQGQDPYKGFSDSIASPPDAAPKPAKAPEPYTPPKTAAPAKPSDTEPTAPRTFLQMEAEGQARPPMPTPEAVRGDPRRAQLTPQSSDPLDTHGTRPPVQLTPVQMAPDETPAVSAPPVASAAPASPTSTDSILQLLTGNATGATQSDLQKATEAKALAQLNGSSPYDSKAVQDEYNYLAGTIDDQFANQNRALDNEMARKGLYGSSGKDFHSGRASDLNVGQRSAKIALAQDLANKFATTKGQYDANAINQGQSVSGQDTNTQRAWLQDLFGYGNDAFNHDLATAQFQQQQNESEQDYLLRLLSLGYGV